MLYILPIQYNETDLLIILKEWKQTSQSCTQENCNPQKAFYAWSKLNVKGSVLSLKGWVDVEQIKSNMKNNWILSPSLT